jgi:hypothetical protein
MEMIRVPPHAVRPVLAKHPCHLVDRHPPSGGFTRLSPDGGRAGEDGPDQERSEPSRQDGSSTSGGTGARHPAKCVMSVKLFRLQSVESCGKFEAQSIYPTV